jgi:hypothetical protein
MTTKVYQKNVDIPFEKRPMYGALPEEQNPQETQE